MWLRRLQPIFSLCDVDDIDKEVSAMGSSPPLPKLPRGIEAWNSQQLFLCVTFHARISTIHWICHDLPDLHRSKIWHMISYDLKCWSFRFILYTLLKIASCQGSWEDALSDCNSPKESQSESHLRNFWSTSVVRAVCTKSPVATSKHVIANFQHIWFLLIWPLVPNRVEEHGGWPRKCGKPGYVICSFFFHSNPPSFAFDAFVWFPPQTATFWWPTSLGSLENFQLQDVALGFPAQHATFFGLLDANWAQQ